MITILLERLPVERWSTIDLMCELAAIRLRQDALIDDADMICRKVANAPGDECTRALGYWHDCMNEIYVLGQEAKAIVREFERRTI